MIAVKPKHDIFTSSRYPCSVLCCGGAADRVFINPLQKFFECTEQNHCLHKSKPVQHFQICNVGRGVVDLSAGFVAGL